MSGDVDLPHHSPHTFVLSCYLPTHSYLRIISQACRRDRRRRIIPPTAERPPTRQNTAFPVHLDFKSKPRPQSRQNTAFPLNLESLKIGKVVSVSIRVRATVVMTILISCKSLGLAKSSHFRAMLCRVRVVSMDDRILLN